MKNPSVAFNRLSYKSEIDILLANGHSTVQANQAINELREIIIFFLFKCFPFQTLACCELKNIKKKSSFFVVLNVYIYQ